MSENQKSPEQAENFAQQTLKTALYLWTGLSVAMTLFYVSSQVVFIKASPIATNAFEWPLIILGALTFLLGYFFYPNYTKIRKKALLKAKLRDRKQTLLVAFVYQFILFESLGLYGVFISVMTQNPWKAAPFIIGAYAGFALSFPKRKAVDPFFPEAQATEA